MGEMPEQRKSRRSHGHKICPRCGSKSFNVKKGYCVRCGYGRSKKRND